MGLTGHEELVNCVRFTPDDRVVVSASDDRTIRIWNPKTGSCVRILKGHTSMVRTVTVLPQGNRVVSAGTDGTIRLWDIESGQALAIAGGRLPHIWSLTVMDDSRTIISGDYHRHVKVWDLTASTSHQCMVGGSTHPGEVRAVAALPESTHVAVGCIANDESNAIRVWDVRGASNSSSGSSSGGGLKRSSAGSSSSAAAPQPIWSFAGHGDSLSSLAVMGKTGLISSGYDKTIRVWEAGQSEPKVVVSSGDVLPLAAAGWRDGRGFVYGSEDGALTIWDLKKNKEALTHADRHTDGVSSVDISGNGEMIVSAGADKAVRLLSLESNQKRSP